MNALNFQTTQHTKATLFALCMALFATSVSYGMEEPAAKRSKLNTQEQAANTETHPTNPTKTDAETCMICLGEANEKNALEEGNGPLYTHQRNPLLEEGKTACKATFHRTCLAKWLAADDTCPLCKMAQPRPVEINQTEFKEQIEQIKNTRLSIADLLANNEIPEITAEINSPSLLVLSNKNINDLAGLNNIPNIESVDILDLSGNLLTQLAPQTFAIFDYLQDLALNNNQLTNLDPETFKDLSDLQRLHLDHNQLTNLDPQIFKNFNELEELYLDNNQFTELDPEIFAHLPRLQILNLSNNQGLSEANKAAIRQAIERATGRTDVVHF